MRAMTRRVTSGASSAFPDATVLSKDGFIADMTAKMMLEVQAVHFSEGKPFVFTDCFSGTGLDDVLAHVGAHREAETLQKTTDRHIAEVDRRGATKEQEVLEV